MVEFLNIAFKVCALLASLGVIVSAYLYVKVNLRLAPVPDLRVIPSWPDSTPDIMHLRVEIGNKARVRLTVDTVLLQVLEYKNGPLNEWVPFSEDAVRDPGNLVAYTDPDHVFVYPGDTPKDIDPLECLSGELTYHYPKDNVLKIGLKVCHTFTWWQEKLAGNRGNVNQSWTITRIAVRP